MVDRHLFVHNSSVFSWRRRIGYGPILFVIALHCTLSYSTNADSLSATLHTSTVLPYEPIQVLVTLHLDGPLTSFNEDARQASLDRLHLRDQVQGVILRNGMEECRFLLYPVEPFAIVDGSDRSYVAPFCGTPYSFDEGNKREILYARPGEYAFVVHWLGTDSEPALLRIRRPEGGEMRASEIWSGSGLAGILPMLLEQKGDEQVVERFRKLAKDYPDTPYGRYARAAMGLWELKKLKDQIDRRNTLKAYQQVRESNYKDRQDVQFAIEYLRSHPEEVEWLESQPAEPDWKPILAALSDGANAFGPGHVMRQRVLFKLAAAQAQAKEIPAARSTVLELCNDYGERPVPKQVTQLLKSLDGVLQDPGEEAPSGDSHP